MSRISSFYGDEEDGVDPHAPAAYDPAELNYGHDADDAVYEEEDPKRTFAQLQRRALWNILALIIVVLALVSLFVISPLVDYYSNYKTRESIVDNVRVNSTGQVPQAPQRWAAPALPET